jgi:ATP-GRASP peptide maturase of grasp-with-spasm system
MILILSPLAEKSVNEVTDWLLYNNQKVFRIRELSEEDTFNVSIDNFLIEKQGQEIYNNSISSFWCRKGDLIFNTSSPIEVREILEYVAREWGVLKDFFIQQLEQKKHLGNYFQGQPNKLNHLFLAKNCGLEIPETIITDNVKTVNDFRARFTNIIHKSLKDSFTGVFDEIYYYNHTVRISEDDLQNVSDTFFPSLFQEELEKSYELRIVFVNDTLWTMAIFSQNDEKTSIDLRNYNHERPNRKTPYKLPPEIATNIRKFIKVSGLNTGAIDMVVTKDKRFVFLECNPNGQISMVSETCNYFIEKHIAEYLSS